MDSRVQRLRRLISASILGTFLLGGTAGPQPAQAAFPGANGRIAFSSNRDGDHEVFIMNADGSGVINLTNNDVKDADPAWSADGTNIAFVRDTSGMELDEIYVMKGDGSGQTNITNHPAVSDIEPSWSPDGSKIAFRTFRDGSHEIFAMNADGSGQTNLTNNPAFDVAPAWSPDGTKIAFQSNRSMDNEIYVMDADGTDPLNLTQTPGVDDRPAWSPDGTKIAFQSERDGDGEVFVMNADGSGQLNLTNNAVQDGAPQWSPDGTKIIFTTDRTGDNEVFVMNADGSGQTNLTNNSTLDGGADWQPLPPLPKAVRLKAKPKKVVEGDRVRLKATVSPCEGHEGDVVEFYRKKKRIATKTTNATCVAKLKVRLKRTTRFRAVSPMQDLDHLEGVSKRVKVRVK